MFSRRLGEPTRGHGDGTFVRHLPVLSLLASMAAAAGLFATGAGCLACDEPGCSAGFSLRLEAADPEGFEPGAYRIEVTLEQSEFEVACVFTDNNETSVCEPPHRTQGDSKAELDLQIGKRADPDRPDPVGYLFITAVDTSNSDGQFKAYRGPEYVQVRVVRDGEEVGSVEYTPEYDRRNHRGDPACGYCDESEELVDSV